MQNDLSDLTVAFKNKAHRRTPTAKNKKRKKEEEEEESGTQVTYVIPGFADRWREKFTPSRFRGMGIGLSDNPEEMDRIMSISECMLAELPGKLAQLMDQNRIRGQGELTTMLMDAMDEDCDDDDDDDMEEGEGESESDRDDPVSTPYLPWNQGTRDVLDSLLDDYQLESLVSRTPFGPNFVAVADPIEETCKSTVPSHREGFIPCATRRDDAHQPLFRHCVSV